MASTFIVTVHACGGSTGEAIDVDWGFTVRNAAEADQMAEILNENFAALGFDGRGGYEELYAVWAELPDLRDLAIPQASVPAAQMAQVPGYDPNAAPGVQVALDIRAWIQELKDHHDNDTLHIEQDGHWKSAFPAMQPPPPPPVTPEEEQAAIQSILRGYSLATPEEGA